jgi:1,4-alpha-glucan branching enzyme
MWAHPGKKLLFMGGEFGQWSEWYCKRSLDWHLLEGEEDNPHRQLQYFTAELNRFYLRQPALWQQDFAWQGFKWLDFSDTKNSIISFARFAGTGDDHLVTVLNFTPQTLADYRIGLPSGRRYQTVFCSDEKRFGGAGLCDESVIKPEKKACGQAEFSARLRIPPLAGFILRPV